MRVCRVSKCLLKALQLSAKLDLVKGYDLPLRKAHKKMVLAHPHGQNTVAKIMPVDNDLTPPDASDQLD